MLATDPHRLWRSRGRIVAWVGYAGVVAFAAMVAAAFPEPALLAREAALFALLQPLFLAVATALDDAAPALVNVLVLTALTGLRGGLFAAAAAVTLLLLATLFFAGEHVRRVLAAYGARRAPRLRVVLGEWARLVLPPAAALAAWMILRPPAPSSFVRWGPAGPPEDLPREAYALLSLLSLVASGVIGLATRLFRRRHKGEAPSDEVLTAAAIEEEPLPVPRPKPPVHLPGRRGRVVRAYARFLDAAAGRGRPRPPHVTASEYVAALPAAAAGARRLTTLFSDARYGRDEPDEATALLAEGLVGPALHELPGARARSR
jgi:hypothetical protein